MTGVQVVNLTNLSDSIIEKAVAGVSSWAGGAQVGSNRNAPLSLFSRGSFTNPSTRGDQLWAAQVASEDAIVSNALDALEGVATSSIWFESEDDTTESLMNKVLQDIDLNAKLRQMYRELRIYGLFTAAAWWTSTSKQVSFKAKNNQTRKKTIQATVPERLSILDVTKVIPFSTGPWGTKQLLWQHSDMQSDPMMDESGQRLFSGYFQADPEDSDELTRAGAKNINALWRLNPRTVWQHSITCPDYMLFPTPPMVRVLPLLEMRARLLEADRAALVGAANYILVVKLGTDLAPTNRQEIEATNERMKVIHKLPVVVGDHRLVVEIVAPPTDTTLNEEKHAVADAAIYCQLMGLPPLPLIQSMDPETIAGLVVARIESDRQMLANAINRYVADEVAERTGGNRIQEAKLAFKPRQVQLYNLQAQLNAVLSARQRGDLSRESYLDTLGFDQAVEADRRDQEAERYDEIFQTQDPFSAPADNNNGLPKGSMSPAGQGKQGVTGGRPRGAGDSKGRTRSTQS